MSLRARNVHAAVAELRSKWEAQRANTQGGSAGAAPRAPPRAAAAAAKPGAPPAPWLELVPELTEPEDDLRVALTCGLAAERAVERGARCPDAGPSAGAQFFVLSPPDEGEAWRERVAAHLEGSATFAALLGSVPGPDVRAYVRALSAEELVKRYEDPVRAFVAPDGAWTLAIVWNTGRCGSTLLHKACAAVGAVSLSEPHCEQTLVTAPAYRW